MYTVSNKKRATLFFTIAPVVLGGFLTILFAPAEAPAETEKYSKKWLFNGLTSS